MAAARMQEEVLNDYYAPAAQAGPAIEELIQKLPPELGERILKELVASKIQDRKAIDWDDRHGTIFSAPFCWRQERIAKLLVSCKYFPCNINGRCALCFGDQKHDIDPPWFCSNEYEDIFIKYW